MSGASNAEKPRKIGRPFEPGNKSGGRPKMPEELKEAFKALAPQALKTLTDVMNNGSRDGDRVKAAEVILDRGYGKATQPIDASLEGSIQVINVGAPAFVKSLPKPDDKD